jgi:catecholate siderophore receptor
MKTSKKSHRRPSSPRASRARSATGLRASIALANRRAASAHRWMVFGAIAAIAHPTLGSTAEGKANESARSHAEAVVDRSSYLADPGYLWDPVSTWGVELHGDGDRIASLEGSESEDPAAAADRKSTPPRIRFDLAPGHLSAVLAGFTAATGIEVELAEATLGETESAGVVGTYTPSQALERLLAGTGAEHHFVDDKHARVELSMAVSEEIDVVDLGVRVRSPKHTEPLLDTPQSISVVDAALIHSQGATTLRDVLRNVTGISIQAGEGGGGLPGDNLAIRGFAARNDIFVDGVRDFGAYSRDAYNIEQVEVTKGPSSVYGGRGSTGGSVNMVTKMPDLNSGIVGTIAGGTDDFQRGTLDLNVPLPDGMMNGSAVRLNLMYTSGDTPGRDQVQGERFGIAPTLALGLMGKTRFWLSGSLLEEDNRPEYGIPWVPPTNVPLAAYADQPAPVDFDNFYGLNARDYEEIETRIASAIVDHDIAANATMRALVRGGSSERDSVISSPRFASNNSTDLNRQLQSRDLEDDILASQVDFDIRMSAGSTEHTLVTGVEVSRETAENRARSGPAAPLADLFDPDPFAPYAGPIVHTGARTESTADTTAAYAFDTVQIGERFEVMGGLRYDSFGVDYDSFDTAGVLTNFQRDDDMLSFRSGVVYKPMSQGSVYAAYGTSFNPSAEGNTGLSLTAATVLIEPEKSRSAELGTKWELFERRVLATAALFETEKTNARTPGIDPGDPPTVLQGRQQVRGFEVGLNGRLSNGWTAFVGYTHLESEVLESNTPAEVGKELANTPEDSFSGWLTYRFRSGFEVGGGAQYVGDRWNSPTNVRLAPGYWKVDATVAYPVNERLSLRLNALNLTDEDYIDRVGGGHFVPGAGRSASVSADINF